MSLFNAYMALSGAFDATVARDERMAHRTTYRIGGPAALFVEAHTFAALSRTLDVLEREGVPWVVLGRGSNVLVADAGFDGCVVKLGRELARVSFDTEALAATAGAGVLLSSLVSGAQTRGLAGLECCVGIPGTVGGAVSMNAGTRHEWVGRRVASVVTLKAGEGLRRYEAAEVEWGYRATSLPADEVILEVTLALDAAEPARIAADMEARLARRRRHQPMGRPCCGSVFRNPPDRSAGALVEECGLKGYAHGGAVVSDVHANFIVNAGGATAADVVEVMHHVRDAVAERFGIDLVPEVKFLGFGQGGGPSDGLGAGSLGDGQGGAAHGPA